MSIDTNGLDVARLCYLLEWQIQERLRHARFLDGIRRCVDDQESAIRDADLLAELRSRLQTSAKFPDKKGATPIVGVGDELPPVAAALEDQRR